VNELRRKDLALLAYLCVEGPRPHSRARLAALLWGESPERKARHSLTQALRRIREAAGTEALKRDREQVRATGIVQCDAVWLLEGDARLDPLLTIYEGPFLEGFELPFGSQEFSEWADGQRAKLRNAALRWLDRAGEEAEAAGDWALALQIGERAAKIEPVHEEAHRRVLRALIESGERNRALRYYQEFARWLAKEIGAEPDPETVALADQAGASDPAPTPPPAPAPPPPCPPPPLPDLPASESTDAGQADERAGLPSATPEPPAGRDYAGGRRHCAGWALAAGALTVALVRALTWLLGE
jgi:DNA-binding SARP family transcriptional activator